MRPATRRRLVLCRREWELEAPDWNAQGAIADGLWEREGWHGRRQHPGTNSRGREDGGRRAEGGGRRAARGSRLEGEGGGEDEDEGEGDGEDEREGRGRVSVRCRRGWIVTIDRSQVGLCLLLWGSKGSNTTRLPS